MAIRNIREMGDEVLGKVCKEVTQMTPRTRELIEDMLETMYEANGVGLAAPQVTYIMRCLHSIYPDMPMDATTVEEAKNDILKYLEADK